MPYDSARYKLELRKLKGCGNGAYLVRKTFLPKLTTRNGSMSQPVLSTVDFKRSVHILKLGGVRTHCS